MNNFWKTALAGAAGAGLLAASGGTLAAPFAGILGGAGEGAAATTGAAVGTGAATTAATGAAAPAAAATTAFVTPPVTAGSAALDAIAASQPGYVAGSAGLDAVAASQPGYAAGGQALDGLHAGGMLSSAGKAASAYGTVNNAMGGQQAGARPAPAPQPIFQGQAAPIAPAMRTPQTNQFTQMMLAQRQRGLLG